MLAVKWKNARTRKDLENQTLDSKSRRAPAVHPVRTPPRSMRTSMRHESWDRTMVQRSMERGY